MRTGFSIISDTVFLSFSSFLILSVFLYYFTPYPFSLIISVALAIISGVLFYRSANKKRARSVDGKLEKQKYESAMLNLAALIEEKQAEFFYALYCKEEKSAKINGDVIELEKTRAILPLFSFSEKDKGKILRALARYKDGVTVLSENFSESERAFFGKFGKITLKDGKEVFSDMKAENLFPEEVIVPEKKKKKTLLFLPLYKKKAVSFLLYGLFFLSFSFFVPIKTYYLAFGTAFILSALLCRVFGKEG